MKYSVLVTSLFNGSTREYKNVIADGFVEHQHSRFFILEDGIRVEISSENVIFDFSSERMKSIEQTQKNS